MLLPPLYAMRVAYNDSIIHDWCNNIKNKLFGSYVITMVPGYRMVRWQNPYQITI